MRTTNARDSFAFQFIRPPAGAAASVVEPEAPLAWWRRRRPDQLFRKDAASLRLALAGTCIKGEARWRDAAAGDFEGDGALAIGICVRQIKRHPMDAIEVDLAVSATLANALLGDAASTVLMSWALKHRAKLDPPCALLSDLWLVADF